MKKTKKPTERETLSEQYIFRLTPSERLTLDSLVESERDERPGSKVSESDVIRLLLMTNPRWVKAAK